MLKSNIVQQSNNTTPNMNCPVNTDELHKSNDAASNMSNSAGLYSQFCLNDKVDKNKISSNSTEVTFEDMTRSDYDYFDHQKLACSPKKLNFKNNNSFHNYKMPADSPKKSNPVPYLNLDSIKQNADENEDEPSSRIANNREIET